MARSISVAISLEGFVSNRTTDDPRTYPWNPHPTDLDWLERCNRPLGSPLAYMLPMLANKFFAALPLRFILFGAMKHARDRYSVRNAMRAALEAFDQIQNPIPWSRECVNIDRTACATQRRAGNERIGRIVSTLIRACHFSLQDREYWRSMWNYEEVYVFQGFR